jgi:hypothetical protein
MGSIMEYMYSLDCEANSADEAIAMFNAAFPNEGKLFPFAVDVDEFQSQDTSEKAARTRRMQANWMNGYKWESGGYQYGRFGDA